MRLTGPKRWSIRESNGAYLQKDEFKRLTGRVLHSAVNNESSYTGVRPGSTCKKQRETQDDHVEGLAVNIKITCSCACSSIQMRRDASFKSKYWTYHCCLLTRGCYKVRFIASQGISSQNFTGLCLSPGLYSLFWPIGKSRYQFTVGLLPCLGRRWSGRYLY
jgi:hypothetical protein